MGINYMETQINKITVLKVNEEKVEIEQELAYNMKTSIKLSKDDVKKIYQDLFSDK